MILCRCMLKMSIVPFKAAMGVCSGFAENIPWHANFRG